MTHILSIQSHVASGYVGNRAAVFPLQRLGCEVSFINTVQFSNHTGYGHWQGDIFSAEHIQKVINGLWQNGTFKKIDAILSGYQGSVDLGKIIVNTVLQVKTQSPKVIYCCDPVIGDIDRGIYVLPETANFIKTQAIKNADIITPNQFELAYLTNLEINSSTDVLNACQLLHKIGPGIILVTSLTYGENNPDHIEMMVSTNNNVWKVQTPRFKFIDNPSGSGDTTAAIFLAHYLKNHDVVTALEHTAAALYAIFKFTHANDSYELRVIEAQDEIVAPKQLFKAIQVV